MIEFASYWLMFGGGFVFGLLFAWACHTAKEERSS